MIYHSVFNILPYTRGKFTRFSAYRVTGVNFPPSVNNHFYRSGVDWYSDFMGGVSYSDLPGDV